MPYVAANYERFLEEDLLRLFGRYGMPLPVLLRVGLVPVESDASIQWIFGDHILVYNYRILLKW